MFIFTSYFCFIVYNFINYRISHRYLANKKLYENMAYAHNYLPQYAFSDSSLCKHFYIFLLLLLEIFYYFLYICTRNRVN